MAGKFKKVKVLLLSAALLLSITPAQNYLAFDINENSRQQKELTEENSKLTEQIQQTEKSISEKEKYHQELQQQIADLSQKIQQSNENIKNLNFDIIQKQFLIDEKLEQVKDRIELLKARIKALYIAGDTSSLEIILQAKDFSDFLDKAQLMQSISEYDSKLINGLQADMEEISLEQKSLKENKTQVEKEKRSLEENKEKINQLSIENQQLIEELQDEKEAAENALAANKAQQEELTRALEEYNKQLAEQQAARKKTQEEAREKAKAAAIAAAKAAQAVKAAKAPETEESTEEILDEIQEFDPEEYIDQLVTPVGDEWVWPCPGHTYLTSTFDEWRGVNNHGALDIADGSVYGAPVVACYDGTVFSTCTTCTHDYGKDSSCGCGGGYGNYVMIDHGDGRISIYGHLCEVVAEPGQTVSAGQLIGYVGSTGYSTGPHLHFETRFEGVRYDPLSEYP